MSMALNLTTRSLKLSNPQSHLIYRYRYRLTSSNSFTITSALKTSKDKAESKSISAKIVVSDKAPSLADSKGDSGNGVVPEKEQPSKAGKLGFVKRYSKKLLSILSNLPLAIGEMFAIAALMALGTFIDQGESPEYYLQTYPDNSPVLGIFTYRLILALGFDHMFSSPIFLGTLILLGTSLIACTYTTQIPTVKVARRWSFLQSSEKIRKLDFADTLPRASIQDLGVILSGAGFEVYVKGPSLYAFRGLAGRFAPIGVHIALLLIMAGGTLSAAGSFKGTVTVPQGLNFVVGDVLKPLGFLSIPNESFSTEVHVNKFTMEYYDSGVISQYRTDLSLFDLNGKEVLRKTISVNDPLRYGGITIYQTDWDFSALQVKRDNEGPFNLAMAPLELNGDKKLFGTFLPVANPNSPDVKGISLLARDLQSIFIYDQEGKFVGVRRPNSKLPIDVNGTKVEIVDAIGSSGLDMKTDPGVPIVYAGFGFLMLTTCISFLSHAQVWAFQDGTTVVIGGKTNRAKVEFPDEMNFLLDLVPEILESSKSKQPNNI